MDSFFMSALHETLLWLSVFAAPLGGFIIFRRVSFVGDALSHATLGGVAVAFLFFGMNFWALSGGALVAALSAAWMLRFFENRFRVPSDLALTAAYSSLLAFGMLALSHHDQHLDHFLVGDISWINQEILWSLRTWGALVVAGVLIFWKPLWMSAIDPILGRSLGFKTRTADFWIVVLVAISVVALMQAVGLVLVSAYLVLPAASILPWARSLRVMYWGSMVSAILSSFLGLVILKLFPTLRTGAVLSLCAFAIFALSHTLRYTQKLRGSWESSKNA